VAPLHRLGQSLSSERDFWRPIGCGLTIVSAAFAFSIWLTVRSHPEQDLPLWPAWIFTALTVIGSVIVATTLRSPHRDG
jgi:hypothetical protein